jgi:hypothetical protein
MSWFEQGIFWQDTQCADGIVDGLERYLLVRCEKVVGLKRCPRYGAGWKVSCLRKVMLESVKDRF